MRTALSAFSVISTIKGFSTFIAQTTKLSSVENALRRIILMKNVLLLIYMKLKKWGNCTGWIMKKIKNNWKKERMKQESAVFARKYLLVKVKGIRNGFWRERKSSWKRSMICKLSSSKFCNFKNNSYLCKGQIIKVCLQMI